MFNKGDVVVWNKNRDPNHPLANSEIIVTNPKNILNPEYRFKGIILNDVKGYFIKGYEGVWSTDYWKLKVVKKLEEYM